MQRNALPHPNSTLMCNSTTIRTVLIDELHIRVKKNLTAGDILKKNLNSSTLLILTVVTANVVEGMVTPAVSINVNVVKFLHVKER